MALYLCKFFFLPLVLCTVVVLFFLCLLFFSSGVPFSLSIFLRVLFGVKFWYQDKSCSLCSSQPHKKQLASQNMHDLMRMSHVYAIIVQK